MQCLRSESLRLELAKAFSIFSGRQSKLFSKKLSKCFARASRTKSRGGHIGQFVKAPEQSAETDVCGASDFNQIKGTIQVTRHKLPDGFYELIRLRLLELW